MTVILKLLEVFIPIYDIVFIGVQLLNCFCSLHYATSAKCISMWMSFAILLLMMTNPKACFSKHSQWPPKSFRLRQAWELVLLYPSLDVWNLFFFYNLCLCYECFLANCWITFQILFFDFVIKQFLQPLFLFFLSHLQCFVLR